MGKESRNEKELIRDLKKLHASRCLALAYDGNFKRVERLLYIAQHTFEELPEFEHFTVETPEHYKNVTLSCSS